MWCLRKVFKALHYQPSSARLPISELATIQEYTFMGGEWQMYNNVLSKDINAAAELEPLTL